MSEEIKQEQVEPAQPETVEEPATKPEATETKTFTQDEVNDLIAKRLEREKKKLDKYADYDDLKTKASEYEAKLEEQRLAELSEQERLQEIAKKHEEEKQSLSQQLAELKTQAEREKVHNAFYKAAPSVNIPADRIDAALKLADLSAVKVGEEGVEGLDEVLNSLVDNYKFLAEVKKPQKPIGDASNESTNDVTKTAEQQLEEAAKKARKTNRQEDIAAYLKLKRELNL
jgi:hypothetical protein